MVWQDTVFLLGNLMFGACMIPQIRDLYYKKATLNIATGVTTLSWLVIFAVTYSTLNFWLAVLGDILDSVAWTLVLGLSIRNRSVMKKEVREY